jgi:hypothetical protein
MWDKPSRHADSQPQAPLTPPPPVKDGRHILLEGLQHYLVHSVAFVCEFTTSQDFLCVQGVLAELDAVDSSKEQGTPKQGSSSSLCRHSVLSRSSVMCW